MGYGSCLWSWLHSAMQQNLLKMFEKSGGKLTIVTHPGGSLFKGGEKSSFQAQIGERFMSALGKEDPLLEVDQPFLANYLWSCYETYIKLQNLK